jgi:hypothetical protein
VSSLPIAEIDRTSDLLDRLRLDRAARRRGAVVVEGPSDAAVLATALGLDIRQFFPAGGRRSLLEISDRLAVTRVGGVVCVVDQDFDTAAEDRLVQWWLVVTDGADLEAMLLSSPALARVLTEWAAPAKLSRFGGDAAVRDWSCAVVVPVSIMRRASAEEGLAIVFDDVDLADVIDRRSLELRLVGFLDRLAHTIEVSRQALEARLASTAAPSCFVTGGPLVRGRDAARAIEVALTRALADVRQQQAKGLVEPCLRIATRAGDLDALPFRARLGEALRRAVAEPI